MPEAKKRVCGLVNRAGIRRFLLDEAKRTRTHRFERVAPGVYGQLEAALREQCRRIVRSQPSAGKTIR